MASVSDAASEEDPGSGYINLRKRKKTTYHHDQEIDELDEESHQGATSYAVKIAKLSKSSELEDYRKREALRAKLYRYSLSEEKKKKANESARLRMQKYRAKLKEKKKTDKTRILTRKEKKEEEKRKEERREYWKIKKRESRSRESLEKKKIFNLKRKQKYHESKAKKKLFIENYEAVDSNSDKDYNSSAAGRKAVERCSKHLPKTPKKWLRVVGGILKKATPKKKKLLNEAMLVVSPKTKSQIETNKGIAKGVKEFLKKNRGRKKKHLRHNLVSTIIKHAKQTGNQVDVKRNLGIQWRNLVNKSYICEEEDNRKRSDALTENECEMIQDFYRNAIVSVEVPSRKSVSKKTLLSKSVMTKTTKKAYELYSEQENSKQISLSTFRKLRPKSVLTANKTQLRQCLCEYCTNIELKLNTLKTMGIARDYKDVYDLQNDSLCPKVGKYHKIDCIERKCNECGISMLRSKLSVKRKEANVTWQRWENTKVSSSKDKDVKVKKLLVTKNGTQRQLIDELLNEMSSISLHLFVAGWQYGQFNFIKQEVPDKWVVVIADFAENYRTFFQDEIQSAHWQYQQVTLHPTVAYYRCPEKDCNEIITESMVCISDDLRHDASSVHAYMSTVNKHLSQKIPINHEVQFTDGCSAQYKSREPFMDLSCGLEDYNFSVERNFFGSRHGKGPCDGLGAVIKQAARRAVERREVTITNAKDMYDYCSKSLSLMKGKDEKCCHKLRTFFYVSDIKRNRSRNPRKALPGTRKVHCVKGVQYGEVAVRNLSCFCSNCISGSGKCINQEIITQPFKNHVLEQRKEPKNRQDKTPELIPRATNDPVKETKVRKNGRQKTVGPKDKVTRTTNSPSDIEGTLTKDNHKIDTQSVGKPTRRNKKRGKGQNRMKKNAKTTKDTFSDKETVITDDLEGPAVISFEFDETTDTINILDESLSPEISLDNLELDNIASLFREEHFEILLEGFRACSNFDQLSALCVQAKEEIEKYEIEGKPAEIHIMQGFDIDQISFDIAPGDLSGPIKIPLKTNADGNCLPRCGSLFAFRSESRHIEIRARIVIELALNQEQYLNDEYLKRGTNSTEKSLSHLYAAYSDFYIPGSCLTINIVRSIFEAEVLNCRRPGTYMGIWQIFALANVLRCPIMSCYPEFVKTVRKNLHRLVLPSAESDNSKHIAHIMWTSTRKDMRAANWVPNHFVPLVEIDGPVHQSNEVTQTVKQDDDTLTFTPADDILTLKQDDDTQILEPEDDHQILNPEDDTLTVKPGDDTLTLKPEDDTLTHKPDDDTLTLKPDDDTHTVQLVGNTLTLKPDDDTLTHKPNDDTLTLKPNDDTHTVQLVDNTLTLKPDDDTLTLKPDDDTLTLKPDDDTHTVQPVGNTLTLKPVGNTLTLKPDDDTLTLKPDDDTLTLKPDDDTLTFKPDDDTLTLKPDDDTHTVQPVGNTLTLKPDDDTLILKPDDDTLTLKPDDDTHTVHPVGNTLTLKPDDDTLTLKPDDDTHTVQPVGNTLTLKPDDDTLTLKPDDDTLTLKPVGNTLTLKPDDDTLTLKPDDDTLTLKPDDDTLTLKPDDDTLTLKPDDDTLTLKPDDDTLTLKPDDDTHTVQPVDDTLTLKPDDDTHTVQPVDNILTLKPDDDTLTLKPDDDTLTVKPDDNDNSVQPGATVPVKCYPSGTFMCVSHGENAIPAVVDNWPYIRFMCKRGKVWTEGPVLYTVEFSDVICSLDIPDIEMKGSRVYYQFPPDAEKKFKI